MKNGPGERQNDVCVRYKTVEKKDNMIVRRGRKGRVLVCVKYDDVHTRGTLYARPGAVAVCVRVCERTRGSVCVCVCVSWLMNYSRAAQRISKYGRRIGRVLRSI